ncbi:hypothetical protein HU200_052260 [Digitaria exilis]|uniref:Pentatricopeptide repeat-containing protein n=1 Tax=Digitaria exilis TaxID=1010633 RepID=A0A835AQ72_9POAL|nr:hypothetical protein HU200_052260 [Digitaria exilis]
MRPPPLPPPPAALSRHHLLRIRRCLPPDWLNAAPARSPSPPPPPPPAAASSFSASSLASLLYTCTAGRARFPGEQVHARAVALGVAAHPSVLPRLASFYLALGDLPAARAAVEIAAGKARAFPWNLLIWGYAERGMWADVVRAYGRMPALGVGADRFTYPSVLRACGELRDAAIGRGIERRIERWMYGLDMYVWNALVGMYAKCGELEDARRVFDGMPARDVVSWNAMVSGYASAGMWGEAFELLQQVPGANIVTWNIVAAGNLKAGNYDEVVRLVSQMRSSQGPGLDFMTVVIGLKACGRNGYLRIGRELHGVAVRLCFDRLERVECSLITMYSRCQMMSSSYCLFRACSVRSMATWNSLLAGFAFMDQVEEAVLLFREMIESSFFPNDVTLLTMLSLSARVGHLCHGREMHCYILKHGLSASNLLQNSLVDMYSKSGQMEAARRVFDQTQCQDRHAYTSLILGYGMQREGLLSLKLFDEMIANNIKVDHVTMVAVLSACSHSGLVTQGQLRFAEMIDVFGIEPRVEHFSCMVDLYCREGLLRMAEEIINKMPFQPTAAMLATLIEACRIHGKTEIGDRAAKRLLAMRTNNPGHYKLVANMYISAKRWPELAKVRSLMSTMELNMIPTHSLLESEYDISLVEQDYFLNRSTPGGLSDDMTDTDFSSSEEVKFTEAFGG